MSLLLLLLSSSSLSLSLSLCLSVFVYVCAYVQHEYGSLLLKHEDQELDRVRERAAVLVKEQMDAVRGMTEKANAISACNDERSACVQCLKQGNGAAACTDVIDAYVLCANHVVQGHAQ